MSETQVARDPHLARQLSERGERVIACVTVQRSARDLYEAWCSIDLARMVDEIEQIEPLGEGWTRWKVRGPGDKFFAWEAQIIRDKPGESLAWRSAHADVKHAGSIRFRELPFHRGTEVRVVLNYVPPGGRAGSGIAKMMEADPGRIMQTALARFRQLMETGEIATTTGQPVGGSRYGKATGESPELAQVGSEMGDVK